MVFALEDFGELERHSNREAWLDGFPELIDISYRPPGDPLANDLQPVYDVGGVHLAGWLAWHTDQCFVPRLSRGGVLRAIQVPPHHGRTGFLDKIRLHDTLPDDLRGRIDDLRVVYRFEPRMDRNRFGGPHGAGVQAGLCDGSVRSVRWSVDANVWRECGSRFSQSPLTLE